MNKLTGSVKKISVIIPCFNEEVGLESTLQKIPQIVNEIVVVDGNSSDKSVEIAKKYGAKVIVEKKRGYGLALRTGFNAAKGDIIIALDGDGTYPAEDIPRLYKYFTENKVDFLIGCRFPLKNKKSMPVNNFFGNLLLAAITSLLFNYQITDYGSGMMIFSRKTWLTIGPRIKDNKWFFGAEIKIEAFKDKNIIFDEQCIELRERSGETKIGNAWLTGLEGLFALISKRFL